MDPVAFRLLIPQIPSLAHTAFWHMLGQTDTASKWDLRTAMTVHVVRRIMGNEDCHLSIGRIQATTVNPSLPVRGKTWVATERMNAPTLKEQDTDNGMRTLVREAIDAMRSDSAGQIQYYHPKVVDTEVEWIGYRSNACWGQPLPNISEREKYENMMSDPTRTSETTILYFHGGAYWLCDPSSHRAICSRLAKESNGRVCSVRYRLAPQTAFPGQLLDAFLVYLSLIYPPVGSMHEPVPATHIVFAGDSAGGNLAYALLQLLLQFHRASPIPTARFHGQDVAIPLPAGVATASPWLDVCRSLPSVTANSGYDYLPPPDDTLLLGYPDDRLWPTDPPRGDLFCDLSLLDHPLVSPVAAPDWTGAPPLWMSVGRECLEDEIRCLARIAHEQNVVVQYESYEAMPHVFCAVLPWLKTADRHMRSWGEFCRKAVDQPSAMRSSGTFIRAKSGREGSIDLSTLEHSPREEIDRLMIETKIQRILSFEYDRMQRRTRIPHKQERAVL